MEITKQDASAFADNFVEWYAKKTLKEKVVPWLLIGSILLVTILAMKKI